MSSSSGMTVRGSGWGNGKVSKQRAHDLAGVGQPLAMMLGRRRSGALGIEAGGEEEALDEIAARGGEVGHAGGAADDLELFAAEFAEDQWCAPVELRTEEAGELALGGVAGAEPHAEHAGEVEDPRLRQRREDRDGCRGARWRDARHGDRDVAGALRWTTLSPDRCGAQREISHFSRCPVRAECRGRAFPGLWRPPDGEIFGARRKKNERRASVSRWGGIDGSRRKRLSLPSQC